MVATLKMKRSYFVFLIAVVNGLSAFLAGILPQYLPASIAEYTIPFIAGILTALIVLLATEEEAVVPGPVTP
jgi:hypothetical protein